MSPAPDKFRLRRRPAPMLAEQQGRQAGDAIGNLAGPQSRRRTIRHHAAFGGRGSAGSLRSEFDWYAMGDRRRARHTLRSCAGVRLGIRRCRRQPPRYSSSWSGPTTGILPAGNADLRDGPRRLGKPALPQEFHSRKLLRRTVRDRDGGDADDCILELDARGIAQPHKVRSRKFYFARQGASAAAVPTLQSWTSTNGRPAERLAAWPTPSSRPGDWLAASAAILKAKRFPDVQQLIWRIHDVLFAGGFEVRDHRRSEDFMTTFSRSRTTSHHALYGLIDGGGKARRRRDEKSESDVRQQCDGTAKVTTRARRCW